MRARHMTDEPQRGGRFRRIPAWDVPGPQTRRMSRVRNRRLGSVRDCAYNGSSQQDCREKGSRMPSLLIRMFFFASSYLPLFVILALRNWSIYTNMCIMLLALGGLSIVALGVFWSKARKQTVVTIRIAKSSPNNAEAMSYIVTYIIPFLDLDLEKPGTALSLAVFFLMLAVIYVQSNMIHINPLLNLMGWFIYEVETEEGTEFSLITRKHHISRGSYRVIKLGGQLLLEGR